MQWLSFLQMREAATCMQEVFQFIMSINISRNMLLLLCSISLEFGLKQLSIVFCIGSAAIKLSLQKFAASVDGWAYHVGCFSEELMTGAILFCQHKSELCYGKLPVGCSDRFHL